MEAITKYPTITDRDFQELFRQKTGKLAVVVFTSEWLGSGHLLDGIIERLSDELDSEVNFYRIDIDASPKTPHLFGIRQLPSVFFIRDSEVIDHLTGMLSKSKLREKIEGWLD